MAYKIPWSNFHELNLDWLLEQVKKLREDVDNITGSATPYTSIPEMDGVGSPGTEVSYSRGDHRHPTDTSRASAADLAQEILDRDGADNTLQANIDATDAKIKFSSSAPYMDSSSASAGFSDYMARADHVHPTDTSRASATDLATLTARVDAFSGSASPSDTTPLMDGVGAAGSGGNYSRGDHIHPSDTSKLDKTGGTVTGDLILSKMVTHEEVAYNGWYRIINAPRQQGSRVTIAVERYGASAPQEMHSIEMLITQAAVRFVDEKSVSSLFMIDKIRYQSSGYVDIHIDQSLTSDIMVSITPYGYDQSTVSAIHTTPIANVADSPVGETTIIEYNLHANIVGITEDIKSSVTFESDWTDFSPAIEIKNGTINFDFEVVCNTTFTADTKYKVATIDAAYAPKQTNYYPGVQVDSTFNPKGMVCLEITPAGEISIRAESGSYPYIIAAFTYSIT